jgi:hypothetical protein
MAIETLWNTVVPQLFTADGTALGVVTVASTAGFKVKQQVIVSMPTLPDLTLQCKRVVSSTQLIVGPIPTQIGQSMLTVRTNISAYTVAGGAFIYAEEQPKNKIKVQDINEAVYEQEPTVALRSVLVDQFGSFYGSVVDINGVNRLAVDAAVTISGVTVDLDAFTKDPPDNVLVVGSEDGTEFGIKHALEVAANGLLQVQDTAAETSLAAIEEAITTGVPVTFVGTIPDNWSEIDLAYDVDENLVGVTYVVPAAPSVVLTLSYDVNGNLTKVLAS